VPKGTGFDLPRTPQHGACVPVGEERRVLEDGTGARRLKTLSRTRWRQPAAIPFQYFKVEDDIGLYQFRILFGYSRTWMKRH